MPAPRRVEEIRIKLDRDGRFVIPLTFRDALGIKAGDEIVMRWEDDELCITKKLRRIEVKQKRPRR